MHRMNNLVTLQKIVRNYNNTSENNTKYKIIPKVLVLTNQKKYTGVFSKTYNACLPRNNSIKYFANTDLDSTYEYL